MSAIEKISVQALAAYDTETRFKLAAAEADIPAAVHVLDRLAKSGNLLRSEKNNMTQTLTISYPDTLPSALRMSRKEFEQEARLLLAAKLFEERKVTSGQAAEMAGLSRSDFLLKTAALDLAAAMPAADEIMEDAGV